MRFASITGIYRRTPIPLLEDMEGIPVFRPEWLTATRPLSRVLENFRGDPRTCRPRAMPACGSGQPWVRPAISASRRHLTSVFPKAIARRGTSHALLVSTRYLVFLHQSMEPLINIQGVWKSYGKTAAVCGLSLSVPVHSIYGFLGPNGAGKSTTIRMILGLQRPDRGRISLFGRPLGPQRTAVLARIGSLVESPSLYPNLTGRENLEVHRRLLDAPKTAIDEALKTVDLISAADQIVRGYSSGMRQRLALAQALLGNPELLVLDEPTNGLDPAGIHQIRALIRDLPNRRGVTVFLSSHLLAEVEQVATHVAIISAGRMRFEGSAKDLRIRSAPAIVVEVDDAERAFELLAEAGIAAVIAGGGTMRVPQGDYGPADINAMLVQAGIAVSHLTVKYPTLEDAFLEMTSSRVAEQETASANDA